MHAPTPGCMLTASCCSKGGIWPAAARSAASLPRVTVESRSASAPSARKAGHCMKSAATMAAIRCPACCRRNGAAQGPGRGALGDSPASAAQASKMAKPEAGTLPGTPGTRSMSGALPSSSISNRLCPTAQWAARARVIVILRSTPSSAKSVGGHWRARSEAGSMPVDVWAAALVLLELPVPAGARCLPNCNSPLSIFGDG